MTPFLPGLSPPEQQRAKIRKRVRPTSRAQYGVARERLNGRAANVLRWLAHHYNHTQVPPTSGELMVWKAATSQEVQDAVGTCVRCALLYVRRGLADLQDDGLVETVKGEDKKDIKRRCAATNTKCHIWRVKTR